MRIEENKNYHFVSFLLDAEQKTKKKKKNKKIKKTKKTPLWHHFKPKQFLKAQGKRENKNYHAVMFLPDALQKIPKKQKKIKKKTIMASFQAKIG